MTKKSATPTRLTTDKTYFTDASTGQLAKPDVPVLPATSSTSPTVVPGGSTATITSSSTAASQPTIAPTTTSGNSNTESNAGPYQQSENKVVIKRYAIKRD